MSELTRPIRRLFGRGDHPADVVTEPVAAEAARAAAAAPAATRGSIAVDIAESDPLLAYLQTRARTGRARPASSSTRRPSATFARPVSRSSSRWSRRAS